MAEPASENPGEVVQGRAKHPAREAELGVTTALGIIGELLGIGDGVGQGAPLLDLMEVVAFVERQQIDAHQ